MAFETNRSFTRGQAEAAQIDVGLRAHMLRVYNYMASGLALTGITGWVVANTPSIQEVFFQVAPGGRMAPTGLGWIAIIAPIGLVMALSFGIARMKASTAQGLFWVYAALMGISLASLLMVYTGTSVARTFFVTAASFGGLSLYGYTTRRDLTGFGSFLFMGLIGIVLASLVNMFWPSPGLSFIVSIVGVLIFAGLTAYDTQKIKEMYLEADDSETAGRKAVMGALTLYLDFINLFIMLLRFMGDRRS
jgi:FtsH-binding integral membrane protein